MNNSLPAVDHNLKDIYVQGEKDFPLQYYVDELEKYPLQQIALHWHTELEFYVVRGCELKIQLGQETLILNEGDGVFVNANVLHAYAPNKKGISTHPNIVFASRMIAPFGSIVHTRYINEIISNEEIPYIILRQKTKWQQDILKLLDMAFSLLQKYSKASDHYGQFPILPFDNEKIESSCYELDVQIILAQIWKLIYEHKNEIPRVQIKKGNQNLQIRIQKMISFIHQNYNHGISLQEIASAAGISKSEAARCFESYLKTSPGRYLQEHRMMEAQRKLLQTNDTVIEIAQSCGFEASSYFCKIFKAETGMTPLQYRKKNMKTNYFLTTDRCGFAHWTENDLPLATSLWGEPEVTRYICASGVFTAEDIKNRLYAEIGNLEKYSVQYFPFFSLENSELIGCCGLRPYKNCKGVYELGFHLRKEYWRKGYATETATAMINYAFDTLGAMELKAGHNPNNIASSKVLSKLGFQYECDEFYEPTGLNHPLYSLKKQG